jgi:serine/threonine-protein kinase ATR
LASAKIARKVGQFDEAFTATLHAKEADQQLGTIEHAKWWWAQGQSRKAVECLQTAFGGNVFDFKNRGSFYSSGSLSLGEVAKQAHSLVEGKAMSLLTRWLDMAKQINEEDLLNRYRKLQATCDKWEKSHYLLGHYYNRLLEHEETKPNHRQRETYLNGELTKLVCHCYLRSLSYGNKYIYETLPRVFTLWLDFGATVNIVVTAKEDRQRMATLRLQRLGQINDYVDKCIKKLPVYLVFGWRSKLIIVSNCSRAASLSCYAPE